MGRIRNALGGRPVTAPVGGYDVFLVAGQSNALGAGVGQDKLLDAPHPNVHQFAGSGRNAGKILAGEHPFWHHTRAPGIGFAQTFGKLHTEATDRPVLLVPVARGESGFYPNGGYTWDSSDQTGAASLFTFSMKQLYLALTAAAGNELRAILWHQGEADVRHLGHDEYAAKLDALIQGFRNDFGMVPFILGQMSPDRMAEANLPGYPLIDAAHTATPGRVPLTAFVEAPSGMFNSTEDKLHFSAAGQRELGRRYYDQYRRLVATSSSQQLSAQ